MIRAAWLMLLLPALALAHSVPHPRNITLHASAGSLQVEFTLELGRGEADRARRLFDFDRSGSLSPPELEKLEEWLVRRAVGGFELRVKETVQKPTETRRTLARGADDPKANLGVRVLQSYELRAGEPNTFDVYDEGDALGHVPVQVREQGVRVSFGAVKLGKNYDLPARKSVTLVVSPLR